MFDFGVLRQLGYEREHIGVGRGRFELEGEAEFEVHTRYRTRLELGEVDAYCGELGDYAIEGARAVRQAEHDAELRSVLGDLHLAGDADEARVVVGGVGDALGQDVESVKLSACARGDYCAIGGSAGGELLGGDCGVGARHRPHLRVGLEVGCALRKGVGVACDFADILELCAGAAEEHVVDLDAHRAHDVETMLHHEIVDLGDGAGGGILDREHSVGAESLLNRLEDALESGEEEDCRDVEHLGGGDLRVGAIGAGAGDNGLCREVACRGCGCADRLDEGGGSADCGAAPRLGHAEHSGEENLHVALKGLAHDVRGTRKRIALFGRARRVRLREIHAQLEKARDFVVYPVLLFVHRCISI